MAVDFKNSITFTKDTTIYGHQSLDASGNPTNAGNGKVSQILDLSQAQFIEWLNSNFKVEQDSSDSYTFNVTIGNNIVTSFTVPQGGISDPLPRSWSAPEGFDISGLGWSSFDTIIQFKYFEDVGFFVSARYFNAYSSDGITWKAPSGLSDSSAVYAYHNGKMYATTGNTVLISSDNGATWTNLSTISYGQHVTQLCSMGSCLLGVTWDNADSYLVSSWDNGASWGKESDPSDFDSSSRLYYSGKTWVYCIANNILYRSSKKQSYKTLDPWKAVSELSGKTVTGIIFTEDSGLVFYQGGVAKSADKYSWTLTDISYSWARTEPCYGNGVYLCFASSEKSGTKVLYGSTNGVDWKDLNISTPYDTYDNICYGKDKFWRLDGSDYPDYSLLVND